MAKLLDIVPIIIPDMYTAQIHTIHGNTFPVRVNTKTIGRRDDGRVGIHQAVPFFYISFEGKLSYSSQTTGIKMLNISKP